MLDDQMALIGWWCWRCAAINYMACKSDSVPIFVPKEWKEEMVKALVREDD